MEGRRIFLFCCAGILFFFVYVSAQHGRNTKNNPPKVEILIPKNDSVFNWDSYIRYSIRVTDAEDGSSEYEEISPKEVFLEVNYFPGISKANENNYLKTTRIADPPGFALMKSSTCFNCHMVKAKLTGPSFLEIARKYIHNSATISMLAKKVIKGTTGVWTNTIMPPNPDFTEVQSKQMIQWILTNADNPNRNHLVGTEGNFKSGSKPGNGKGTYILTASYTDHGLKGIPKSNLRGQHSVVIRSN